MLLLFASKCEKVKILKECHTPNKREVAAVHCGLSTRRCCQARRQTFSAMATIMLGDARLDALVLSMLEFLWQDEEEEHYEVEYEVEEDGLDQEEK